MESHVKPNLPLVVDNPHLVATTPKTDSHWYDGFSALLPTMGDLLGKGIGAYAGGPIGMAVGGAVGTGVGMIGEAAIGGVE